MHFTIDKKSTSIIFDLALKLAGVAILYNTVGYLDLAVFGTIVGAAASSIASAALLIVSLVARIWIALWLIRGAKQLMRIAYPEAEPVHNQPLE